MLYRSAMFWKLPALGKISKIGIVPPRPDPDRGGVAIALIVRNEARHIGEWADFHARAGVARFLVYDNGCTDATLPILRDRLGERCTVVPWRQVFSDAWLGREIHNQVLAYAHAASNFGGAYRWMAFIDADEFLVPKRADSIPAALAHLGDCRSLSLPWHMFGRSGHVEPPEGGVLRNYLRRARDPMSEVRGIRAFKCIADPCHLTALRVHSMETDGSGLSCNDRGEAVASEKERARPGFYSADHLQLNHYYTRSESELAAKIGRGPNLQAKSPEYARKVRRTVANIEADEVEDRAALDYLARIGR
jgi:Glycosyltransferase family 92